jgi:hypothetical protein
MMQKFLFFPGIKQNAPLSLLGRLGTDFSGKRLIHSVKKQIRCALKGQSLLSRIIYSRYGLFVWVLITSSAAPCFKSCEFSFIIINMFFKWAKQEGAQAK